MMLLDWIREIDVIRPYRFRVMGVVFIVALAVALFGIWVYSYIFAATTNCEDVRTGYDLGPECVIADTEMVD